MLSTQSQSHFQLNSFGKFNVESATMQVTLFFFCILLLLDYICDFYELKNYIIRSEECDARSRWRFCRKNRKTNLKSVNARVPVVSHVNDDLALRTNQL